MRHILSVADLDAHELAELLDCAARCKGAPGAARLPRAHAVALLFERPSLRTRAAYEVAMMHLGGRCVAFEGPLGQREPLADVARTLSHLVSLIVARARDHATLVALAEAARVPVVNALSDREHPVEVLADALTLRERWGSFRGRKLAFSGDGCGNVCHSLLLLAPLLGMDVAVASPPDYAPRAEIAKQAQGLARAQGTRLEVVSDPREAASGADALYTDTWPGSTEDAEERRRLFAPYQLNRELLSLAKPDAVVLHCLPARRGEEVTADVLDGPQSLAFARLSNLVPVTMAVLHSLLAAAVPSRGRKVPRVAGLHAGAASMSDDFDEPPPEES